MLNYESLKKKGRRSESVLNGCYDSFSYSNVFFNIKY